MKREIVVHNIVREWSKFRNDVTGYYHCENLKHLTFPIPAPPKIVTDNYENLKTKFMSGYRSETADSFRVMKAKELGKDKPSKVVDVADQIRNCIDEYTLPTGKPDIIGIMSEYSVGHNSALLIYKMAMRPKNTAAVDKGRKRLKEASQKHVPWTEVGNVLQ